MNNEKDKKDLGVAPAEPVAGPMLQSSTEDSGRISANVPNAYPHESWDLWSIAFVGNWYDWEISGTCTRDGKRYVFEMIDGGIEDKESDYEYRVFGIFQPPPEKWIEIDECRKDFEQMVGTHSSYDLTEEQKRAVLKVEGDFWAKWPTPKTWREMKDEWLVAIGDSRIRDSDRSGNPSERSAEDCNEERGPHSDEASPKS